MEKASISASGRFVDQNMGGDMYFIGSLALTAAVIVIFCFAQEVGFPIAGPNTFVPGLLAICAIGVALGVAALRADRDARDRKTPDRGGLL